MSLTETVLGAAVTQTNGGIQIALTGFVIVFPILIAGSFFLILWNKSYVFYPPTEFGGDVDPLRYVEAMQRRPLDENQLYSSIQKTVRSTITSAEVIAELTEEISRSTGKPSADQIAQVLGTAADRTLERIREVGFLTIDSRPFLGPNGKIYESPYNQSAPIAQLLDDIWVSLTPHVPPATYGKRWVLRERDSGRIYPNIGIRWAQEHVANSDERSLKDVGIVPGMRLEVVAPKESQ